MKSGLIVCLAVFLAGAPTLIMVGCRVNAENPTGFDWPQWRGPRGDGQSQETGWDPQALSRGPKMSWNVDVGEGYSNVAIQGKRLYTLGLSQKEKGAMSFTCLNAHTGRVIWQRYTPGELHPPQSTPASDGDRVFGLTYSGLVLCLNAENGKVLWQTHLEEDLGAQPTAHGWAASPVVEGNLLLINANDQSLALDKSTGETVWAVRDPEFGAELGSFSTTVVSDFEDGRCALFLAKGTLQVVEVGTGRTVWSFLHGNRWHPVADPVVSGNRVFLQQDDDSILIEFAGKEPRVLWRNDVLRGSLPTPVLLNGYLYSTHGTADLQFDNWSAMEKNDMPFRCVEWETGRVMWEKSMRSVSATAADGKLLLLEINGTLHIVENSSSSYKELSSADVLGGAAKPRAFATPPVLCGGRIYCRNFAGDLICLDVSG